MTTADEVPARMAQGHATYRWEYSLNRPLQPAAILTGLHTGAGAAVMRQACHKALLICLVAGTLRAPVQPETGQPAIGLAPASRRQQP